MSTAGQFHVLSEMFADCQNVHIVITPQILSFDDMDIAVLPGFDFDIDNIMVCQNVPQNNPIFFLQYDFHIYHNKNLGNDLPLLFPVLSFSPDYNDPLIRQMLLQQAMQSVGNLFGNTQPTMQQEAAL